MARHLEGFKTLEGLQVSALEAMKSRGVEGLTELLARQQAVLSEIADRKAELKSYLDRWQALEPSERERLRQGKAGEILAAMDAVANAIQGRHQDWFGAELPAAGAAPAKDAGSADKGGEAGDLSQMINIYRGLQ